MVVSLANVRSLELLECPQHCSSSLPSLSSLGWDQLFRRLLAAGAGEPEPELAFHTPAQQHSINMPLITHTHTHTHTQHTHTLHSNTGVWLALSAPTLSLCRWRRYNANRARKSGV